MKMHLEKAIFVNRAPFERLDLDFNENEIAVLSAVNGRGKTTILSHIVDAFHEMARPHFPNEFENKENKFYRLSSSIHSLKTGDPSFVYLRFKTSEGNIDYVDIKTHCTEEKYNTTITLADKIPYSQFSNELNEGGFTKSISKNLNRLKANKLFGANIITYFPSYRHEQPGYLNDPYSVNLNFKKKSGYVGYLTNPIEVVSGLPQIANWIMDVVLDLQYKTTNVSILLNNINNIITLTLVSKKFCRFRFGVGPRGSGGSRLSVINADTNESFYPNIFNLSSGESSTFCLFAELLRQADNNNNNVLSNQITGIVLIDEVDKHLHIKLQKEVLPQLFNLFPNVQFIVSSHSPFLSMGLSETVQERSKIIDLDNFGISKDPTTNGLYSEVYNMIIGENERFKEMYGELKTKMKEGTKPLIITEGKTDIQHIRTAMKELNITDIDVDYFEFPDGGHGDTALKTLLENTSKVKNARKIIGIFDRDNHSIVKSIEDGGQSFKNYGNNVFAFCIPVPSGRESYSNISIEFYYTDSELKKEKDGKCLYFDNELHFDKKRQPNSKVESPIDDKEKKIYCENIGNLSFIHSKGRFAELVENDAEFRNGFEFNKFSAIFDKIREIALVAIIP